MTYSREGGHGVRAGLRLTRRRGDGASGRRAFGGGCRRRRRRRRRGRSVASGRLCGSRGSCGGCCVKTAVGGIVGEMKRIFAMN